MHICKRTLAFPGGPGWAPFSNRACIEARRWYLPANRFGMKIKLLLVKNIYRVVLKCTVEILYEEHVCDVNPTLTRNPKIVFFLEDTWNTFPGNPHLRLRMVQRPSVSDACVPSVTRSHEFHLPIRWTPNGLDGGSHTKVRHLGVSKNNGTPKWMVKIMENPIKMEDLGVPLFSETPTCATKRKALVPVPWLFLLG